MKVHGLDMQAFNAMTAIAANLALPKRFHADLHTHDKAWLAQTTVERFAWAIGDDGTWIAHPGQFYRDATAYAHTIAAEYPHTFLWDGRALVPVTVEALVEFLAR